MGEYLEKLTQEQLIELLLALGIKAESVRRLVYFGKNKKKKIQLVYEVKDENGKPHSRVMVLNDYSIRRRPFSDNAKLGLFLAYLNGEDYLDKFDKFWDSQDRIREFEAKLKGFNVVKSDAEKIKEEYINDIKNLKQKTREAYNEYVVKEQPQA